MPSTTEKPAILGGEKVKTTPYASGSKHDPAGFEAMRQRTEGLERLPLAMGPSIKQLRQKLTELLGVAHAVPTTSGTAALHTGLAALGIKPGDQVITSPATDAGTIIGIMQLNAVPVFADIDPQTLMIEADTIAPRITDRTTALVPVHYHGCPADMDQILALGPKHGLKVLEDCAQSWLAAWRGRWVGTIGDAGAFSMNESKHLNVGEGGVLITDDPDTGARADRFMDKAYDRVGLDPNAPDMIAINYRMSELVAVLALKQLEKARWLTARRTELGDRLVQQTRGLAGVSFQQPREGGTSTYWHALMILDPQAIDADAPRFAEALLAEGIQCQAFTMRNMLHWKMFRALDEDPGALVHFNAPGLEQGAFPIDSCPNVDAMAGRLVRVRVSEFMSDQDMDQTIAAVRKIAAWFAR